VIDGEGSVFLSKVTHPAYRRGFFYRPQLDVSNSNRLFLVKVQEIIGEGTVHIAKNGAERWKTRWEYCGVAGVLRTVLPQILPYMIIKRKQAETTIGYFSYIDGNPIVGLKNVQSSYYEKLDAIYWALKKLNTKGRSADSIAVQ
jgi:hypothetical protein